jgi:hypothetical protein
VARKEARRKQSRGVATAVEEVVTLAREKVRREQSNKRQGLARRHVPGAAFLPDKVILVLSSLTKREQSRRRAGCAPTMLAGYPMAVNPGIYSGSWEAT